MNEKKEAIHMLFCLTHIWLMHVWLMHITFLFESHLVDAHLVDAHFFSESNWDHIWLMHITFDISSFFGLNCRHHQLEPCSARVT